MAISDDKLRQILSGSPVIAVVGASPNPARPSYQVMKFLIERGFDVIPIRPKVKQVLGYPCRASLAQINGQVDIVDVFRRPEACPKIAAAAVAIGARALWLQEGIISDEAGVIAGQAGLEVVMDRCIMKVILSLDI